MSTRVEIQPSDIRLGDLIRWEKDPANEGSTQAIEWTVTDSSGRSEYSGKHYLLDRPKQTIVLPDIPTLGWVTFADGSKRVGLVRRDASGMPWIDDEWSDRWGKATAFTEAVAVPKSALAELWSQHGAELSSHACGSRSPHYVCRFLAAAENASTR